LSEQIQNTQARKQGEETGEDAIKLDYSVAAELFPSSTRKGRAKFKYRRFGTAAEAIRFAMEEVAPEALSGAYLEVDEMRFGYVQIRSLYDSAAYPLDRREAAPSVAARAEDTPARKQGLRAAVKARRPVLDLASR
jgi:hypothetical protein